MGVYIVDKNKKCYSITSQVTDAAAVAVITDDSCVVMGLSENTSYPGHQWLFKNGLAPADIPAVPTELQAFDIIEYSDGDSYSNAIISWALSNGYSSSELYSCCAAFAVEAIPTNVGLGSAHLGSAGEWQTIISNISNVLTALRFAGSDIPQNEEYYWTSCEHSEEYAWAIYNIMGLFVLEPLHKSGGNVFKAIPFYNLEKSDLTLA